MTAGDAHTLGIRDRARRGLKLAWRASGRGFIEFYNSHDFSYASSIAFFSLLSFFPFMLLVITVLSRIAVDQAGNERVVIDLVERALPSNFDFLSTQIVELQRTPAPLTILGTLVTIWASMGVFSAITAAVDHAWLTEKPRTYLKHQLIAFLMMIAAALVFTAALFVLGAGEASDKHWFASLERWFPWITNLSGFAARNLLTPAVIVAIGLVYYYAPNTYVRFRDVWFGAVLAGVLWRLALAGFSWYLQHLAAFSVHGSVGTVVAFMVWMYLSALILLYGVEVTAAYARARRELNREEVLGQREEGRGQR